MLPDIVVDTNILVHASNEEIQYCPQSIAFLTALLAAKTILCVDEGFSLVEELNRSLIGHEYLEHLHTGMFGFAVVVELASTKRVKIVNKSSTPAAGKRLNQLIGKKTDRRFVKITLNSASKVLTSHDFEDFPLRVRARLRAEMKVAIQTAEETRPSL